MTWAEESGGISTDELKRERTLCHNPGCPNPATNKYRMKQRGCGRYGSRRDVDAGYTEYRRAFCDLHAKRGDSNLDDIYEVVSGRPAEQGVVRLTDVSESAFGSIIELTSKPGSRKGRVLAGQ